MSNTSSIAFGIGIVMASLTLINGISITEVSPSLQRAEIISALSSISIILIGFLSQINQKRTIEKSNISGEQSFLLDENLEQDVKSELAWGSQMILTATASATILIYLHDNTILKRGIISDKTFIPGKICFSARDKKRYISLVSTKFYPGKNEFDSILLDLPSVIIFPLSSKGWLIVGGWSERCYKKSDEIWIEGWSKKIDSIL